MCFLVLQSGPSSVRSCVNSGAVSGLTVASSGVGERESGAAPQVPRAEEDLRAPASALVVSRSWVPVRLDSAKASARPPYCWARWVSMVRTDFSMVASWVFSGARASRTSLSSSARGQLCDTVGQQGFSPLSRR